MQKKRIVAGLLAVAMMLLLPFSGLKVQAEQVKGEGWSLSEDGYLNIESNAGVLSWANYSYSDEAIENPPVVEIVEFSEGVTKIVDEAFMDTRIKEVKFPSTLTEIGWRSFTRCDNLKSIVIPEGVITISKEAFSLAGLETITFISNTPPENIAEDAFQGVDFSKVTINVPEGSGNAYNNAFSNVGSDITVNESQKPEGDDVMPPTGDDENKEESDQPEGGASNPSNEEEGNRGENGQPNLSQGSSTEGNNSNAMQIESAAKAERKNTGESQLVVMKPAYKTTAIVAGKATTVTGVFILEKGYQVAVVSELNKIEESFNLKNNEIPFAKITDMDVKRSHLAAKSLNDTAKAMEMKCVGYLNMEVGKMVGGSYRPMEETGTISFAIELPSASVSGTYGVLRATEGGKVDFIKVTMEKKVMSFESTPGLAAYAVVMY